MKFTPSPHTLVYPHLQETVQQLNLFLQCNHIFISFDLIYNMTIFNENHTPRPITGVHLNPIFKNIYSTFTYLHYNAFTYLQCIIFECLIEIIQKLFFKNIELKFI